MGISRGSPGATAGPGAGVGCRRARRSTAPARAGPAATSGRARTARASGRAHLGCGTRACTRSARSYMGRTARAVSSCCLAVLGRTAPSLCATSARPTSTIGSAGGARAIMGIAGCRAHGSARPLRTGESVREPGMGFGPTRGGRSSAAFGRLGRARGGAGISAGAFLE
jgi:hypothetical protein